jgi:hypothetical protein
MLDGYGWADASGFNPRAREERDLTGSGKSFSPIVSIHALAKSATWGANGDDYGTVVSIHALAKSATLLNEGTRKHYSVSIHALAKSATAIR